MSAERTDGRIVLAGAVWKIRVGKNARSGNRQKKRGLHEVFSRNTAFHFIKKRFFMDSSIKIRFWIHADFRAGSENHAPRKKSEKKM